MGSLATEDCRHFLLGHRSPAPLISLSPPLLPHSFPAPFAKVCFPVWAIMPRKGRNSCCTSCPRAPSSSWLHTQANSESESRVSTAEAQLISPLGRRQLRGEGHLSQYSVLFPKLLSRCAVSPFLPSLPKFCHHVSVPSPFVFCLHSLFPFTGLCGCFEEGREPGAWLACCGESCSLSLFLFSHSLLPPFFPLFT